MVLSSHYNLAGCIFIEDLIAMYDLDIFIDVCHLFRQFMNYVADR
jgi:hypothetical protein